MDGGHGAEAYGEAWAGVYDDWHSEPPPGAIDFLASEAEVETIAGGVQRSGRVLELAAGTGRFALPLAARGFDVVAVDSSPAMLDRLRSKLGQRTAALTSRVEVVEADMAGFDLDGSDFAVAFCAASSLFLLLTQDLQLACFEATARHLSPTGRFVVEAFVPDLTRFTDDRNLSTRTVADGVLRLDASEHDPITQVVRSHHVFLRPAGTQLLPVTVRYAWPTELDLMARLCGLRLVDRFGGWQREPFTAWSPGHVSVYARDPSLTG